MKSSSFFCTEVLMKSCDVHSTSLAITANCYHTCDKLAMFPDKAFLFFFLSLGWFAVGLGCRIYVSSSDGINNTSCWTGGVQTPCATINLAIQGTATLQYNCSSGILINLSPGTYTLDTTSLPEQQLLRNNVSIIGMRDGSRYEEVSITCLHVSSSSYNWLRYIAFQYVSLYNCSNIPVTYTEPNDCPISLDMYSFKLNVSFTNLPLSCTSEQSLSSDCKCEFLKFTASIIDEVSNDMYNWKNDLLVCTDNCSTAMIAINNNSVYTLDSLCFNEDNTDDIEIYIRTFGPINASINLTANVTKVCDLNCLPHCEQNAYKPPVFDCVSLFPSSYTCNDCCFDNETDGIFSFCQSNESVPINMINKCVQCEDYSLSLIVFFLIEILPVTMMVILIIILNIKLTNGLINGIVFYSQLISIVYSDLEVTTDIASYWLIPNSIFNLDFTPFLGNYSLCIAPHMSPLGAISFWYVVGFYPLLLLLLLYVWITLYDKGYKCVVLVTRPFHRCMARFWRMTSTEPSFTHSIASIYILCFTQLATISVKILRFNPIDHSFFFYDANQKYFEGPHIAAALFSVFVLLVFILLPTLYLLLYRFKWFHKLLDCLHLRKQLLISLGDVFTGPYKNGTDGTSYDYRFFAGLYLMVRIITLALLLINLPAPYDAFQCYLFVTSTGFIVSIFAIMIMIFRPFKRNIHSFFEVLFLYLIMIFSLVSYISILIDTLLLTSLLSVSFSGLIFGIILPIYILSMFCKQLYHHYKCRKATLQANTENQQVEGDDNEPLFVDDEDWVADRMENPQEYDEQHVSVRLDNFTTVTDKPINESITINTAATYGSVDL